MASEAAWSDADLPEDTVDRAETLSQSIRQEMSRRMSGRDRARSRLDPHRLVRPKPPTRPPSGKIRQTSSH